VRKIKLYLKQFKGIVPDKDLEALERYGDEFFDLHVLNINSTHLGGGVAELLSAIVPLFDRIGLEAQWEVMSGGIEFFNTTKYFYNGLQGQDISLDQRIKQKFKSVNKLNAVRMQDIIKNADIVIIHDHQPVAMINYVEKKQPWIWRCHADIHTPDRDVWNFLLPYINCYDKVILSMEKYKKKGIKPVQNIVHPSIDPTNEKNMDISEKQINKMLSKHGIDRDSKPIISQISRFDKWKDPIGVIKTFRKVREKIKCKLVLLGETALDDPEGPDMYNYIMKETADDPDIYVISEHSPLLVNVLQRASSVVLQKSLKEGFALTVAEALWKGTPVVGTPHGGIPLQIIDGKTGYLAETIDETAKRVIKLLENRKLAAKLGKQGKEHIRKHFLITRHALDYLKIFKEVLKKKV